MGLCRTRGDVILGRLSDRLGSVTNKNKIINQAQKFIQKGQWDKAIKELQKLVAEDPSDVRTLLKLGDVYAKKGERDQATKVYKQVA